MQRRKSVSTNCVWEIVQEEHAGQEPLKDEDAAHPVATVWRPTWREIVKALAEGDYGLTRGVVAVAPVSAATAERIRGYIASYGETLTELPDESWQSSISQWMRTHWEAVVDLSTVESGRSGPRYVGVRDRRRLSIRDRLRSCSVKLAAIRRVTVLAKHGAPMGSQPLTSRLR